MLAMSTLSFRALADKLTYLLARAPLVCTPHLTQCFCGPACSEISSFHLATWGGGVDGPGFLEATVLLLSSPWWQKK